MPGKFGVGAIVELDDMAISTLEAVHQFESAISLPASLADDQQPRGLIPQSRDEPRPYLQQQEVVLSPLDRSESDEGRSVRFRDLRARGGKRRASEPRRDRRRLAEAFRLRELSQAVQRRLAVTDHARGSCKDGPHPLAMDVGFAVAAEMRVCDGDEVVNEIDRPCS